MIITLGVNAAFFDNQNVMDANSLEALAAYLKEIGLTQGAIANKLGVSQPYINALMTGRRNFGKAQAYRWRDAFGINPSWLLVGEGPMLLSGQPTQPPARQPKSAEAYLEELEGSKLVGQRTGERGSDEDEDGNWAKVKEAPGDGQPYYDVDFLGGYGEFVDHPEDARPEYFIDFKPYNRKGVFYVNLRGDSMAPEFNGGDLLALRPVEGWWDYLLLGKVYAIVTKQGQRTIKRLRKGPSSEAYQLEPINPAYDKQDIPKDQIAAVFEVLGGIRHYE